MSATLNVVIAEVIASWLHHKQLKRGRQRAAVLVQLRGQLDQMVDLLIATPKFGLVESYAYKVAERYLKKQPIDAPMRRLLELIELGAFGRASARGWNRMRRGVHRAADR